MLQNHLVHFFTPFHYGRQRVRVGRFINIITAYGIIISAKNKNNHSQ